MVVWEICSVVYPRQKNLENLGIYLCAFKNVSFQTLKVDWKLLFKKIMESSVSQLSPSAIPMQITDSSFNINYVCLQSSYYL